MFNLNLVRKPQQMIAFDADGTPYQQRELTLKLQLLVPRLQAHSAKCWLINVRQPLDYLTALLALWHAGKTPVLLPNNEAGTVANLHAHFDAVLSASDSQITTKQAQLILPEQHAAVSCAPIAALPTISEQVGLYFYTSGSTGAPKQEYKTWPQLFAEIMELEHCFGAELASSPVYASVSCQHIYGFLFRLLWPWLSLRPFANFNLEFPEQLEQIDQAYALVTSPALLKRLSQISRPVISPNQVFSSGGLLSQSAANLCQQQLNQEAIEVLGSTETGGVAWRKQLDASAWRRFDKVQISLNQEGFLQVASPYFSAEKIVMGDRATLLDNDHFQLLGRGDRLVKIEEKRVSLIEIEQHLCAHPWVAEAAAIALELAHRQAIGCALVLTQQGQQALLTTGKHALNQALSQTLRPYIEAVALPKKYRYLNSLPYNSQGKLTRAALQEVFND